MDLLEGLEDIPTHRRTFKKQIDIHIEQEDEPEEQAINGKDSVLGFNRNVLTDLFPSNAEQEDTTQLVDDAAVISSTPHVGKFNTLSDDIIKNVQRRLNGELAEDDDEHKDVQHEQEETQSVDTQMVSDAPAENTQVIPSSKTQVDTAKVSIADLGFGTRKINLQAATISDHEEDHAGPDVISQVGSESEDEITNAKPDNSMFLNESDNDHDDDSSKSAKEKRALKIAERAAAKRALREQLENEKKVTAQEMDEFDEAENSKIVSSVQLKKRSKKDERILAETKRLQREVEFVPAPSKNKRFDKAKLLADFGFEDEDSNSSPIRASTSPNKEVKSTPSTSPISSPSRTHKRDVSPENLSDDDFEEGNILDLLDNTKRSSENQKNEEQEKSRRALNNPLRSYEERLNDSTVNRRGMKVIELDSDPEVDTLEHLKQHTSKETILDVKTKFVQKRKNQVNPSFNINKFFPGLPTKKARKGFVASVNSKAARQLRDIIIAKKAEKGETEDVQNDKEGLNIQDLLEREIERNIRLRKKEARHSKDNVEEAEFDSSEDGEYDDSDNSDINEEESEAENEDDSKIQVKSSFIESQPHSQVVAHNSDNDDENEEEKESVIAKHRSKHKQNKIALLSDDDEDHIENEDSIRSTTQPQGNNISYMYGAKDDAEHIHENVNEDQDDFRMGSYGSQPNLKKMLGISMTQAFESTLPQGEKGTNLMEDLRNKHLHVIGEEEEQETSFEDSRAKDSFLAEGNSTFINKSVTIENPEEDTKSQTQAIEHFSMPLQTQNIVIGTQADSLQTVNDITQFINQSQTVKPQSKRKLVRKLERILQSSSESEEESESDEETRKINVAIAKEKQRQKDIRRKRQMKEWKRKGVTDIVDDEATESEDEFHGLGGADGDYSDQENSEDEKMLDDTSKVDLKANELRSKFAEDEKLRNENDVRKLFEDIKTGRLRKRRGGDSLDIELSEDEEDMKNFYMSRLNKQRDRLLQNEKIASIAANDKSRAFFETIAEKPVEFKLDDDNDVDDGIEVMEAEDEEKDEANEDNPFVQREEAPAKKKRKLKVSHDYITTTIAEVCDSNTNVEEDEARNKLFAKYQHGFTDEVEDEMDLLALKKQSSILMSSDSKTKVNVTEVSTSNSIQVEEDDDDEDDDFNPIRKSSVIKSFQKFNSMGTNNGVKEVEVTISKAYKSSTTSKASIGYLANKNNSSTFLKGGRTLKARNIEKDLKQRGGSSSLSNVFKSGNFN